MPERRAGSSAALIHARPTRVFFDADALIAGAASTTGASHLLLRLSELTLLEGMTCRYVVGEVERNLLAKLPAALPAFRLILEAGVDIVPDPSNSVTAALAGQADPKDLPVLSAAIAAQADFLATFNTRHFRSRRLAPLIRAPSAVVVRIRRSLAGLLSNDG